MQERNRAKVLAAARAEFVERGFREAKIDVIAERAGLTRGAVYSNFPGKRALYFAVLAADAASRERSDGTARTPREALAALARSWLGDLPLATDGGPSRLAAELLPVILADERVRRPFAQLTGLTALLVGLALERLQAERTFRPRMVRVAEAALTILHGAGQLAAAAPGFVDEMVVVDTCAQLADADFADRWAPPHLEYIAPARPVDLPFRPDELNRPNPGDDNWPGRARPPYGLPDRPQRGGADGGLGAARDVGPGGGFGPTGGGGVRPGLGGLGPVGSGVGPGGDFGQTAADGGVRPDVGGLGPVGDGRGLEPGVVDDGVLVLLGLHRLTALEEAVRAAPRGVAVVAALVTGEAAELAPLARLVLADADRHLGAAFPAAARPAVRIVLDEAGDLAAAAGVTAVSDATETAVRIRGGRIVGRADGPGAPHAAASFR